MIDIQAIYKALYEWKRNYESLLCNLQIALSLKSHTALSTAEYGT